MGFLSDPKGMGRGLAVMAVASVVVIAASGPLYSSISKAGRVKGTESIYTPGTYTASAQGFMGPVEAEIVVSDKDIEELELRGDSETPEIGGAALGQLKAEMLKMQSAEVDSVSGATFTSEGAKQALNAALAMARGEEAPVEMAAETEAVAAGAEVSETPAKEQDDKKTEEKAEPAEIPAANDGITFKPGTYEGVGAGRNGDIKVEVTLTDAGIQSVEVVEHEETPGIGDKAIDGICPAIFEQQKVDVDNISGATITSKGIKEAVTDALKKADIDASSLKGLSVAAEKGEDQVLEADVVIIGAGGAGMAAAASAAEEGAKVIVLEEMSFIGGNTTLGEGTYNVSDPVRQELLEMTEDNKKEVEAALTQDPGENEELASLIEDTRADYEAYLASGKTTLFDSPNWQALQTYEGGGSIGNIPLIRRYAQDAVPTFDWLENEIGVPFKKDYIFMPIGGKWSRGHQVDLLAATGKEGDGGGKIYIDMLKKYAEERGAQIITDADVKEILTNDEGAVVGAYAERSDGSSITVNAAATILTTGGFAANSEMVYEYSGGTITTTMTSCAKSSMGDGIKMAEKVGAAMVDLDQIQVHPLGDPINDCGCVAEFVGNWLSAVEYMFVNKEGNRFVKEDGTRYEMSMAELEQTDEQMWLIVDSSEIAGDESRKEQIESLIASGHSYAADTLEELAEQIGVDPEALVASVEKYNEGMKNGEDEFGKATSEDSVIETAPFYASLRTPTVHHTMGGVVINTETEVLDTDGNVIPGFYSAGEVTGGVHGNNRLGGNAYPDIMTYGRIAGKNAAAAAK